MGKRKIRPALRKPIACVLPMKPEPIKPRPSCISSSLADVAVGIDQVHRPGKASTRQIRDPAATPDPGKLARFCWAGMEAATT
jgi:hypothetical protein